MNPQALAKLISFILLSGPSIVDQCLLLLAFVDRLKKEYLSEPTAASEPAALSEAELDTVAGCSPEIAALCAEFESSEPGTSDVSARGALRDLFKFVVENPEQVRDLIEMFKKLFAPAPPTVPTTQDEAA